MLIDEIVEKIDKLRVENNFSIYELANKSDTSINTIKYLYKRQSLPNLKTIMRIADAFEVPVWFMLYKGEKEYELSRNELMLITNYSKLSETSKRIMLELSDNMK